MPENNELLDDLPGDEREEEQPAESVRPDPISIAFDGPPGPTIVREGEELPAERQISGSLATTLLVGLAVVLALAFVADWLIRNLA